MVEISLVPAQLDIAGVRAGDRNLFQITIRQSGRPIDLTDYTVTAQARTTPSSGTDLDAVCEVTEPTLGKVEVRWPGDAVRTWLGSETSIKGVWDLQLDDAVTDPWTVVAGSFSAELDITR